MNDFHPGDRIDVVFVDGPQQPASATVSRLLSDQQEGLSPEAEIYVLCWMEIVSDDRGSVAQTQTIAFCTDWKYYLDGREVKLRKCAAQASSNA